MRLMNNASPPYTKRKLYLRKTSIFSRFDAGDLNVKITSSSGAFWD